VQHSCPDTSSNTTAYTTNIGTNTLSNASTQHIALLDTKTAAKLM
jgi:hypothetical protein